MPRQITPEMVHPTHDVREEGIYISDPRCQICRVSAVEGDTERLLEPCDPNRRSKISAISTAMTAIIDERIRQIEAEGWTPDHDDEHDKGELAAAAACYAYGEQLDCSCGPIWPFGEDGRKPQHAHDLHPHQPCRSR